MPYSMKDRLDRLKNEYSPNFDSEGFDHEAQRVMHMADRVLRRNPLTSDYAGVVSTAEKALSQSQIRDNLPLHEKKMKEILADHYIGIEGLRIMERELGEMGLDITFNSSTSNVSKRDVEIAQIHSEDYIVHPESMDVNGITYEMTLNNFIEILRSTGTLHTVPFIHNFCRKAWYKEKTFSVMQGQLRPGIVFVGRSLFNSADSSFEKQQDLMKAYESQMDKLGVELSDVRSRTPFEAVFDTFLRHFNQKGHAQVIERMPALIDNAIYGISMRTDIEQGISLNVDSSGAPQRYNVVIPTRGRKHKESRLL